MKIQTAKPFIWVNDWPDSFAFHGLLFFAMSTPFQPRTDQGKLYRNRSRYVNPRAQSGQLTGQTASEDCKPDQAFSPVQVMMRDYDIKGVITDYYSVTTSGISQTTGSNELFNCFRKDRFHQPKDDKKNFENSFVISTFRQPDLQQAEAQLMTNILSR